MKFLVDMGISPKTAIFLRQLHHDVYHLHEFGLGRMSDADILDQLGSIITVTENRVRVRKLPVKP